MMYTINELATLAGVSVRTLHHYDEIGLLSPARAANGYRSYGEAEVLRLQNILFFRELEYPLEDIAAALAKPGFDLSSSLAHHRGRIEAKKKRFEELLSTIDKTLGKLAGETRMDDDELFEAFMKKHDEEYVAEAEERWGGTDAYAQSAERVKKMSKDDLKRIAAEGEELTKKIAESIPGGPGGAETQALITRHYANLRAFYEPTPALYRGLGNMYVDDPRFRAYYERFDPALPEFMRDAIDIFCDSIQGSSEG